MSDSARQVAEDHYFTALDAMAEGRQEEALAEYQAAVAADPSFTEAMHGLWGGSSSCSGGRRRGGGFEICWASVSTCPYMSVGYLEVVFLGQVAERAIRDF